MTVAITDDIGRIPMSPFLKATLVRAADYAASQMHREVTLEHLLLALAEDPEASIVLKSSDVDITRLMSDVSNYIGRIDDRVEGNIPPAAAISADLRRILEASAAAASQGRRREINGAIVLAAIVGDAKSPAAHMLRSQGLTFEQAIRALQQAAAAAAAAPAAPRKRAAPETEPVSNAVEGQPSAPAPRAGTSDDIVASARERDMARPAPPAEALAAPKITPAPAPAPVDPMAGRMAQASSEQVRPQPVPATAPPPQPPAAAPAPQSERPVAAPPPSWAPAPLSPAPEPAAVPRMPFPPMNAPMNGTRPPVGSPAPLPPFPPATQGPSGAPPIPGAAQRMPFPPQPGGPQPAGGMGTPAVNRPPAPPQYPPWSDQGQPRGPHYDEAMARLEARRPQPPMGQAPVPAPTRGRATPSPATVQAGQLVENIPRKMRAFVPVIVEARIARAEVKAISDGLQGGGAVYRHEVTATSAMSVRLRAPDGGFTIETASPETQWIENVLGLTSNDYASWRWSVCPQQRGKKKLQLIISARTVGADGLTAETALPDQVIDVTVGVNVARTLGKWMTWITAAVAGGLLSHFGETIFEFGKIFLNRQ